MAVIVRGFSMSGVFEEGDVVGAKKVTRFSRYKKGDIIVFTNKDGERVIHMIVDFTYENGKKEYITWGVNNKVLDNDPVGRKDIIGKVVYSAKEQYKILDQARQGKILIVDAFGKVVLADTKKANINTKLKNFISEFSQVNEDLENLVRKLELKIERNAEITRYELKNFYKELNNQFENLEDLKAYRELIEAMAEYAPYFWLDLDAMEIKYIEEIDPKLKNTNYNKWLKDTETKKIQLSILKKQWGDRDATTGEPLGYDVIIRHDFKLGKTNKRDCSRSALVPVLDDNHDIYPGGEPHTALWTKRFDDAKYYIKKGFAYIPAWWSREIRNEYEAELVEDEIPYINGRVN